MRVDFLREPRQLTLFDHLVESQRQSRFSFPEEEMLQDLWRRGEDCHLGEDLRFKKTRWGRWCLSQHKVANQDLITRLIQSWDGVGLQPLLASLDSAHKSRCILDLGDPRLSWDGHKLALRHLPLHPFDHPAATCLEGWLPLWRSSQLTPLEQPPRPQYLRLRRPLQAHHFALYLDSATALAPVGALLLCQESDHGPQRLGWQGSQLALTPDGNLGSLIEEILLRDLHHLQPEEKPSLIAWEGSLDLEAALSDLTRTSQRRRRSASSPQQPGPVARWVLDSVGGLYAQMSASFPEDQSVCVQASGQPLSPQQLLAASLGCAGLTFLVGAESWSLSPPDPDRVSLFRASTRERSARLQTRCLASRGPRRWLVPPALAQQAASMLDLPGVILTASENAWMVLEVDANQGDLPAPLLDSLGLYQAPAATLISFRGSPPLALSEGEEGDVLAFPVTAPPSLWIDLPPTQSSSEPILLLAGAGHELSLSLHGDPPWRVELADACAGFYRAQFRDRGQKISSDPVAFELLAAPPPPRFYPDPHWVCHSDPWTPPLQGCDLGDMPEGLCLQGPPCWPLQVGWEGGHSLSRALDSRGQLAWAKIAPYLGLPQPTGSLLRLHLPGLASLHLRHQAAERQADWSQLASLQRSKFWSLRKLSSLSQCWDHLVAPVLVLAGLEPIPLAPNVWALQRPQGQTLHLWLARPKDWNQAAQIVAEPYQSHLLMCDGIHWASSPPTISVSLEECLERGDWGELQALLQESLAT